MQVETNTHKYMFITDFNHTDTFNVDVSFGIKNKFDKLKYISYIYINKTKKYGKRILWCKNTTN